jgi:hypothetical protein
MFPRHRLFQDIIGSFRTTIQVPYIQSAGLGLPEEWNFMVGAIVWAQIWLR